MPTKATLKKIGIWALVIGSIIFALFWLKWTLGLGHSDKKEKATVAAPANADNELVKKAMAVLERENARLEKERDGYKKRAEDCEGSKKVVKTHKHTQPKPKVAKATPPPVSAQVPPPAPAPKAAPVPPAPAPAETVIVKTRVKTRVIVEEPVEERPVYERREVVRERPPVVVYGGGVEYGYVPPPVVIYGGGRQYCEPRYQPRVWGGHQREYRGGGHVYNPGGPRNPPTGSVGGPANPPLGGQRGGGPANPPAQLHQGARVGRR